MSNKLTVLSREQCIALTVPIGRLIYTVRALPAVAPVNFILDGRDIVLRVGCGSSLAAAIRGSIVAFEVGRVRPGGADRLERDSDRPGTRGARRRRTGAAARTAGPAVGGRSPRLRHQDPVRHRFRAETGSGGPGGRVSAGQARRPGPSVVYLDGRSRCLRTWGHATRCGSAEPCPLVRTGDAAARDAPICVASQDLRLMLPGALNASLGRARRCRRKAFGWWVGRRPHRGSTPLLGTAAGSGDISRSAADPPHTGHVRRRPAFRAVGTSMVRPPSSRSRLSSRAAAPS